MNFTFVFQLLVRENLKFGQVKVGFKNLHESCNVSMTGFQWGLIDF